MRFLDYFSKPNVKKLEKNMDIDGLLDTLQYKDDKIQKKAVVALGNVGDHRAVEPLIKIINVDQNKSSGSEIIKLRILAAEALGKIGGKKAFIGLTDSLKFDHIEYRVSVIEAIGRYTDKRAVNIILTKTFWFDSASGGEDQIAQSALINIGEPVVIPLKKFLREETTFACLAAKKVLVGIGKPAIKPLIKVLEDDPNYWTRMSVAKIFGEIGDRSSIEPLIKALKDDNASVRNAAKMALKNIKRRKR